MNYILQINAFWEWRKLHTLSHAASDLYFALLSLGNTARWQQQFCVPNSTILMMIQISQSELYRRRSQLCQLGLITYQNGWKGQAGTYSIIPLYDSHMDNHAGNINKQNTIKQNFNQTPQKSRPPFRMRDTAVYSAKGIDFEQVEKLVKKQRRRMLEKCKITDQPGQDDSQESQ